MVVAIVTGANKGIGFQVVKDLCKHFKGTDTTVYLTARDQTRGEEAVQKCNAEGLFPHFLQMDVTNPKTIDAARDFIKEKHGGVDILVNNAAILPHAKSPEEFEKQANETVNTNVFGLLDVCDRFFPLLRPHARVVNVSSCLSSLYFLPNKEKKARVTANDLTIDELKGIMKDYLSAVKSRDYKQKGYSGYPDEYGSYPMTKIAVSALSRVQQRDLDKQYPNQDIVVNAIDPGYVATDMTNHMGNLTVEQGADTIVYASLLPPQNGHGDEAQCKIPRGQFLCRRRVVDWVGDNGVF